MYNSQSKCYICQGFKLLSESEMVLLDSASLSIDVFDDFDWIYKFPVNLGNLLFNNFLLHSCFSSHDRQHLPGTFQNVPHL